MSERAVGTATRASGAMTVDALVDELATLLAGRDMPDASDEARDIVAALHEAPRFWPRVNAETRISAEMCQRARGAARARCIGAPLAYAVGLAPFRHLTLEVDPSVLIPRPETERLVDLVLAHAPPGGGIAIDVGTGSGAIALSLACEGRFTRVYATDISLDALAVARRNMSRAAATLRSPVELLHGSMLGPIRAAGVRASIIVSNPPYIADGEAAMLPTAVRDWEPPVALYSGGDGLVATRRLVAEAVESLEPGGLLAIEVDTRRASLVAELVAREARFQSVRVELDLTGRERFVLARRQEGESE